MRPIHIEAVLNGYVVTVGCQRVVFESRKGLMEALARYLENPYQEEQWWLEMGLNAKLVGQPTPLPPLQGCLGEGLGLSNAPTPFGQGVDWSSVTAIARTASTQDGGVQQ